ncbi:hypothetical protein [Vibrio sp. HN007]|uniref:hypothetical protein n=1 Tax=Vibrio iocasae TaxID=3098914 RepID=UPI0035D52B99
MTKVNAKETIAFVLVLLVAIVALSILNLPVLKLPITGDDTWGATAVLGNPLDVLVFNLRWDLHPPLYYLLLDVWALISRSDIWLRANSMFFHALLVSSVFLYTSKRRSLTEALIATILVFSSPLLLEYSGRIRMYSLLALLSFVQFVLVSEYSKGNDKLFKWIMINAVVILCSHAIGILFVFFHFCYGLPYLYKNRKQLVVWSITHFSIFLLSLPVIANSAIKSVGHAIKPDITAVIEFMQGILILDYLYLAIIPLVFILLSLRYPESRNIIICYLVLPVVFYFAISHLIKPLWLERNFIFALPPIYIALAGVIVKLPLNRLLKLSLPGVIVVANLWGFIHKNKPEEPIAFSRVVEVVSESFSHSNNKVCVVAENTLNTFWSLQRYLNGVNWGHPLEKQPPVEGRWAQISKQLPAPIVDLLALNPAPSYTENKHFVLSAGLGDRCFKNDIEKTLLITDRKSETGGYDVIYRDSYYTVFDWTQ